MKCKWRAASGHLFYDRARHLLRALQLLRASQLLRVQLSAAVHIKFQLLLAGSIAAPLAATALACALLYLLDRAFGHVLLPAAASQAPQVPSPRNSMPVF